MNAAAPITLQLVVTPVECGLPDADTDVLIWYGLDEDSELGALIDTTSDGLVWVNAQGDEVAVTHWAAMPKLKERP